MSHLHRNLIAYQHAQAEQAAEIVNAEASQAAPQADKPAKLARKKRRKAKAKRSRLIPISNQPAI